jgi:hypothetical protein
MLKKYNITILLLIIIALGCIALIQFKHVSDLEYDIECLRKINMNIVNHNIKNDEDKEIFYKYLDNATRLKFRTALRKEKVTLAKKELVKSIKIKEDALNECKKKITNDKAIIYIETDEIVENNKLKLWEAEDSIKKLPKYLKDLEG